MTLEMLPRKRASSGSEGGISCFFLDLWPEAWCSSWVTVALREPLVLPLGSQASFQVSRGISGFLQMHWSGIGPHFMLRGECHGFSHLQLEAWGSSRVAMGISGNLSGKSSLLSCCEVEYSIATESLQGNWTSSHIEGGILWCFSNCSRKLCVFSSCNSVSRELLMLPQGSQASFQVAIGPQDCFRVAAGE